MEMPIPSVIAYAVFPVLVVWLVRLSISNDWQAHSESCPRVRSMAMAMNSYLRAFPQYAVLSRALSRGPVSCLTISLLKTVKQT